MGGSIGGAVGMPVVMVGVGGVWSETWIPAILNTFASIVFMQVSMYICMYVLCMFGVLGAIS